MESTASNDMGVGLSMVFSVIAMLAAVGLAAFGITGDQVASGWSFAIAVLAGTLAVAAYHVYA
jgi:hypothetical protein